MSPPQDQIYQVINLFPLHRREIAKYRKSRFVIGLILLNEISYSNFSEHQKPFTALRMQVLAVYVWTKPYLGRGNVTPFNFLQKGRNYKPKHQRYNAGFSEHASCFNFPVRKCSSVSQAKSKPSTIETQGRTVRWCLQLCSIDVKIKHQEKVN